MIKTIIENWNGVQWNEVNNIDELPLGNQYIRVRRVIVVDIPKEIKTLVDLEMKLPQGKSKK